MGTGMQPNMFYLGNQESDPCAIPGAAKRRSLLEFIALQENWLHSLLEVGSPSYFTLKPFLREAFTCHKIGRTFRVFPKQLSNPPPSHCFIKIANFCQNIAFCNFYVFSCYFDLIVYFVQCMEYRLERHLLCTGMSLV